MTIWLTGGPGCSSEIAVFYENGPFKINASDLSLTKNPYSWNNNANVVYLDQPTGTGFSNCGDGNMPTDEQEVASQFYTFFLGFFAAFPEYKGRELFVTGESYAGKYVPAISAYLHKQGNPDVNLIASSIGNGWVDPYW